MTLYRDASPGDVGVPLKLFPQDPGALQGSFPYESAVQELKLLITDCCPQRKLECIAFPYSGSKCHGRILQYVPHSEAAILHKLDLAKLTRMLQLRDNWYTTKTFWVKKRTKVRLDLFKLF